MKAPRDEHRRLDSSKDHNESGLHQPHEGRIIEVFERISDTFYAVDCEWRFTYVNRHAEVLWGRSQEELLGKNIWEEFPQVVSSEAYQQSFSS